MCPFLSNIGPPLCPPNLIPLEAAHLEIANVVVMISSTGAAHVFYQLENGMLRYARHANDVVEPPEGCLAQDLGTQPFRETRFYVRGGVFARESCWARRLRR
jgi:hypothetical protein